MRMRRELSGDDVADPGIVRGGIRDRAVRAVGVEVPETWHRLGQQSLGPTPDQINKPEPVAASTARSGEGQP